MDQRDNRRQARTFNLPRHRSHSPSALKFYNSQPSRSTLIHYSSSQLIVWFVRSLIADAVLVSLIGILMGTLYPVCIVVAVRVLPKRLHSSSIGFISACGSPGEYPIARKKYVYTTDRFHDKQGRWLSHSWWEHYRRSLALQCSLQSWWDYLRACLWCGALFPGSLRVRMSTVASRWRMRQWGQDKLRYSSAVDGTGILFSPEVESANWSWNRRRIGLEMGSRAAVPN